MKWLKLTYFNKKNLYYIALILCIYIAGFSLIMYTEIPRIHEPQFHQFDENTNDTVIANIVRKPFPPMMRLNPLIEKQVYWTEGPYWQHIPPLYMYVPLLFLKIKGSIDLSTIRLAFDVVAFLAGLLFITTIHLFSNKISLTVIALLSVLCFFVTPFSWNMLSGGAIDIFNQSDFFLLLCSMISFAVLCWYLSKEVQVRQQYSYTFLCTLAAFISLPLLAKSLLGAIAPTLFWILLLKDYKGSKKLLILPFISFLIPLILYYGALYISAPEVFKTEIFTPLIHFTAYENWDRPWHFFVTNYIPDFYLGYTTSIMYILFIASSIFYFKTKNLLDRVDRIILNICFTWFIWNLIAISLVTSKAPNFIYQSFLLFLFFNIYCSYLMFKQIRFSIFKKKTQVSFVEGTISKNPKLTLISAFIVTLSLCINTASAYVYYTEPPVPDNMDRIYYRLADYERSQGLNTKDLFLLYVNNLDCYNTYYFMFFTGADARTLRVLKDPLVTPENVQQKFEQVHIAFRNSVVLPDLGIPYTETHFERFTIISFNSKYVTQSLIEKLTYNLADKYGYYVDKCMTTVLDQRTINEKKD